MLVCAYISLSLVLPLEVRRPNAIKWRAGQSISDRKRQPQPQPRQQVEQGSSDDGGGEEGSSLLSEIRATELIREGEEIT